MVLDDIIRIEKLLKRSENHMKKRLLKFLIISTLSLSMILHSSIGDTRADEIEKTILRKYDTEQAMLLRNKVIKIPSYNQEKAEEFRGVWVSTVYNLDFPSKKELTEEDYKEEFTNVLDNLEALNMNAIIFQVRSKLDTFYQSKINPWSEYLTGKQGLSPGWDPLEWMIEETHNRGMEFHAWFNPYRVTTSNENKKTIKEELLELDINNWARKNPDFVFRHNGRLYLDPGEPKVVQHIKDTVMEVIENYDIDAVHFDDYFYPDKSIKDREKFYSTGEELNYKKYGKDFKTVSEWRVSNVDKLIFDLHNNIKSYNNKKKKAVQFGISPFGIWGHKANHPQGSITPIGSLSSYDNQFADTRKWVKNNWVDYIAPQIYWTFDEPAAPYGELVHWWADVAKGTDVHLYIGQANYRKADINNKKLSWQNEREISNQLKFNSLYDEIKGSIYFSYRSLLKNDNNSKASKEFINILKKEHYNNKTLLPAKQRLGHRAILSPFELDIKKADNGNILTWKDNIRNSSAYYIIYREDVEAESKKIIKKIKRTEKGQFFAYFDQDIDRSKEYIYSITAIDRANNESEVFQQIIDTADGD